jgi:hypothetical protein
MGRRPTLNASRFSSGRPRQSPAAAPCSLDLHAGCAGASTVSGPNVGRLLNTKYQASAVEAKLGTLPPLPGFHGRLAAACSRSGTTLGHLPRPGAGPRTRRPMIRRGRTTGHRPVVLALGSAERLWSHRAGSEA